jgi:cobyrinic acid a,c-diamide synthase
MEHISSLALPRFVIAGASSGSGKSTLTLALIEALHRRGYRPLPWKVGPDYIDPGHLSAAAGLACRNLDPVLMGEAGMVSSFIGHCNEACRKEPKSLAVIEGVMGLFDGRGGISSEGSTASVAKSLSAPVIVVIDAGAAAQTAGAVALGMQQFDPDCPVAGFIANRIGSDRHFSMVRRAVEGATGLPVLGWLPKSSMPSMPERHLGLVAAWEEEGRHRLSSLLRILGDAAAEHIDLDALLAIAASASSLTPIRGESVDGIDISGSSGGKADRAVAGIGTDTPSPCIAVAMDDAFHFYYQDNLDMLESLGARIVPFSPLSASRLPDGCDGVYIGGGYPELHAERLSANRTMIESIRAASFDNMPIYAECGGLMYLCRRLFVGGKGYPMVGLFDTEIEMGNKLSALGYHKARTLRPSVIGPAGMELVGHIYRWSNMVKGPSETEWLFRLDKEGTIGFDGLSVRRSTAAYLHLHFTGVPEPARHLVAACREYRQSRSKHDEQ